MVAAPETPVPVSFPPFEYATLLDHPHFGDWRDALVTDGFVVVKEAIPRVRALELREQAFAWLEHFDLGFDRNDPKTWTNEHLPVHMKGGMFHGYGIAHEQWVWDVRSAPGVVDAFAKIWGTNELITSFDGASVMLPHRQDVVDGGKWEHTDQSPARRGFYCVQGLVNLNVNEENDGGLMVLKGSSQLFEKFFDEIGGRDQLKTWGPVDWYGFTAAQQKWFYARGCEWVKVCASPGDLILWDSRTMHYNVRPSGDTDRVCAYVCMAPAKLLSDEDRALRQEAFELYRGTTHVPFASIFSRPHEPRRRADGTPCPLDTGIPRKPRTLTKEVLQLAGIEAY